MNKDNKERISKLSPAQRMLFEQRIKGGGDVVPQKKITITRRSDTGTYPITIEQEQLWFTYVLDANATYQHLVMSYLFTGVLNHETLERAVNEIIRRHENLRTAFPSKDGIPVTMVFPSLTLKIDTADVSQIHHDDRAAIANRILSDQLAKRLDLAKGPLLRITLVRLSEQEHAMQVIIHHIVSDKLSTHMFGHELAILYDSFSNDRESPLSELPIQYGDYAVWLRDWYQTQEMNEHLDYWKDKLADPPILNLHTDFNRPAIYTHSGERVYDDSVSVELWKGIKSLSLGHNISRFMTLLTVYGVLLYLYTKQDDIIIGSPVNNREHEETQELLGYFLNMLGFRIDLSGNPTFQELLSRVRIVCLEAFAHQKLSSVKVIQELRLKRDPSRPPLYQVGYVYTNESDDPATRKLSGTFSPFGVGYESSLDDLTFMGLDYDDSVTLAIEYNTDIFELSTIRRMLSHYKKLLELLVNGYNGGIDQISLIDDAERFQLLYEWNETTQDYPQGKYVHELFEEQIEKTPDTVALVYEDQQLSYRELNVRANRLANYLRSLGMGPDQRAAICLERSLDMVISLLAVMKGGGAYVPIDPAYPSERIAWMLEDSAATILITNNASNNLGTQVTIVNLNNDGWQWTDQSEDNLDRDAICLSGCHTAYIIYTSGSTGKPKGVVVEHKNLLNLVYWHCNERQITIGDRCSNVAGLGFDASVLEIWPTLSAGATLLLPSSMIAYDPERLLEWWKVQSLDISFLPTPIVELALVRGIVNSGVRAMLVGGDRLRRLGDSPITFTLVNNYGPAETTVVATISYITSTDHSPYIGKPISNVQAYILDSGQSPTPIGISGEIYIGGGGVSRGYLAQPELTAEHFLPDPFSKQVGGRVYRTRDLGRWRSNGEIDILGRNDNQVKMRGYRIELGEIESRLSEYEDVENAVVIAREVGGEDKRLVAYYTGKDVRADYLRSHLASTLPEYMLPAAYVHLETIPLTPNGKLDRRALPEPEDEAYPRRSYEEPQGEVETILAGIWSELLGVERVGRWDDFFSLGGHSMLAITLIERMQREGLHAEALTLFTAPTLYGLALSVTTDKEIVQVSPTKIPSLSKKLRI